MGNTSDSVIDLTETDTSFTLANHFSLNNLVINLDTDASILEVNDPRTETARKGRKRRHSKPRPTIDPEIPIQDLCTPESKNKKTGGSKKESNQGTNTEEPAQKIPRQSLGTCPICFEDYCGQALASTSCGHVFCLECLKMALKRASRCPTCRTILRGKSKYHSIFL